MMLADADLERVNAWKRTAAREEEWWHVVARDDIVKTFSGVWGRMSGPMETRFHRDRKSVV